jgi:hypothetical protein
MREDQLREEVLMPLLRAMGFRDVFRYHGGSLEQGKDIVMWKPEEFRDRTNFAVVLKAGRITGQASGKSSAAEVCFQIQQAFGNPFRDPVTGEERTVQECIVISSREIAKESIEAIEASLKSLRLEGRTTFWSGDKVWELIEKHFPAWAHLNRISEAQKCFDSLDQHYRVAVNTSDGKMAMSVERKSLATPAPPLKIGLTLQFPDNPKGQEKRKEFERHIKTGSPAVLTKPFLVRVELPELLNKVLGSDAGFDKVELGPRLLDRSFPGRIEIVGDDGERAALDMLQLRAVQAGTEEITFNNAAQNLPWKITFVVRSRDDDADLNFEFDYAGRNVHEVLAGVRFQRAVAKPGWLIFSDQRTGLEFVRKRISDAGEVTVAPDPQGINFIENLEYIQKRAQIPLTFPKVESITGSVVQHISETAEILSTGKLKFPISGLTLGGPREFAERIIVDFDHGVIGMLKVVKQQEDAEVLGKNVPLGPCVELYQAMRLRQGEQTRLKAQLQGATTEVFKADFESTDESPCVKYYLNWLAPEEAAIIAEHIKR